MSKRLRGITSLVGLVGIGGCLVLMCESASPSLVSAAEVKKGSEDKTATAKNASAKGFLIRRHGEMGQPWTVVGENELLPAGDLILGLPGAMIDAANGSVHLNMRSDLDSTSPFPIVENAIVLRDSGKADLSFVLDRGRVDVTN